MNAKNPKRGYSKITKWACRQGAEIGGAKSFLSDECIGAEFQAIASPFRKRMIKPVYLTKVSFHCAAVTAMGLSQSHKTEGYIVSHG
jgi:hypothetical protein